MNDPTENKLVQQAKEDLAQRLSVQAEEIELQELKRVNWRDGSLGCPQPGMVYTQALVSGVCIRLRCGGKLYHYHSGGKGAPFFCPSPTECDQVGYEPRITA